MSAYTPAVAQAFTRFGFGGRPDDTIPADPVSWLTAQITCPDQAPLAGAATGLPTVQQALALINQWQTATFESDASHNYALQMWSYLALEQQSFLTCAVTTKIPFRERLVWFWANHYAIMAGAAGYMLGTSGPYVRDAIRPNMTGTITQMLQSVVLHPAMIYSLNANTSVGPLSPKGIFTAKIGNPQKLNENLGREILELYSVGINAGYTQADVDALAYLLSGLDVNYTPGTPLGTFYNLQKQQPGNFTLMGTTFPGTLPGLMSALQMLGTHPATYAHLATQLVTHFTSDTPSAADIAVVTAAFANSGGSLPAAHQALIGLKNAWVPLQKLRTPTDLTVAALRAANTTVATMPPSLSYWLGVMGQPLWMPPFPNGWSDLAAPWSGPGPMFLRANFMNELVAKMATVNPQQAMAASVGPLMSSRTGSFLGGLKTPREELTLLFCSSEFQRR
jgi:uncharacterized protein (DUF1800 family)